MQQEQFKDKTKKWPAGTADIIWNKFSSGFWTKTIDENILITFNSILNNLPHNNTAKLLQALDNLNMLSPENTTLAFNAINQHTDPDFAINELTNTLETIKAKLPTLSSLLPNDAAQKILKTPIDTLAQALSYLSKNDNYKCLLYIKGASLNFPLKQTVQSLGESPATSNSNLTTKLTNYITSLLGSSLIEQLKEEKENEPLSNYLQEELNEVFVETNNIAPNLKQPIGEKAIEALEEKITKKTNRLKSVKIILLNNTENNDLRQYLIAGATDKATMNDRIDLAASFIKEESVFLKMFLNFATTKPKIDLINKVSNLDINMQTKFTVLISKLSNEDITSLNESKDLTAAITKRINLLRHPSSQEKAIDPQAPANQDSKIHATNKNPTHIKASEIMKSTEVTPLKAPSQDATNNESKDNSSNMTPS